METGNHRDAEIRRRERYLAALESGSRILLESLPDVPYQQFLDIIGPASGADRVQLFIRRPGPEGKILLGITAEWCMEGIEPFLGDPRLQAFDYEAAAPSRAAKFRRGKAVVSRVVDLPAEERTLLEAMGISSVLGLPLMVAGEWSGFIAFNTVGREVRWNDTEMRLLSTAASALSQAIRVQRAETALRESEERYRRIVETSLEGVWMIDAEARIIYANRRMTEILQRPLEEITGKVLFDFMSEESRIQAQSFLANEGREIPDLHDFHLVRRDEVEVSVLCSCSPIRDEQGRFAGALGMMTDVTGRKQADEALMQASRMEATATLAGGIAHGFNNLMVGVLGNAELLRDTYPNDPDASEMLESIVQSARRAGDLAQQLLAFARGGKYTTEPLDLNETVLDAFRLQDRSFPPRLEIDKDLEPQLRPVKADANQMSQVVMNLCINAAEAIEGNGRITVRTRNVEINERPAGLPSELPPGRYVRLTVEDTGTGMGPEVRNRIFEPFFSTKFQGRGLGLAAVYGIVRNHGGVIRVASELGSGSILDIFLPAMERIDGVTAQPEPIEASGTRTLLFIDDEKVVLDVGRRILERFGYRVLTAGDGAEAVEIARNFDGTIDLAILDMGMPNMGGSEVFPLLRKARPGMKVILCSGYERDSAAEKLIDAGASAFVQKPFLAAELAMEIRRALEE